MEKKKILVALALDPRSIINRKGIVKEEILNTVVIQSKRIIMSGCNIFIFISSVARYCRDDSGKNLCVSFEKSKLVGMFVDAFARKEIAIRVHDAADIDSISCRAELMVGDGTFEQDAEHFANACKSVYADIIVVSGNNYKIFSKKDLFIRLFPDNMKPRITFHSRPHFFLDAMG